MDTSTAGPWWTGRALAPRPGPEALPAQAEVAVIGGGLTGVACALFLARGGARPVVLEARDDVGLGASGRRPGLVFPGTTEPPFRLVYALGKARARELYDFCRENADLLAAETSVDRCGGLWAALDDREADQTHPNLDALRAVGVDADPWDAEQVAAATGGAGFGAALHLPGEALIDPAAAVADLARAAVAAGAAVHVRCPVQGLGRETRGVRIDLPGRRLIADVVVLAAEHRLPAVHEFFEDKLTPFREQALLTAPVDLPLRLGLRAQYGYFTVRRDPAGRLIVRGARWATPHLEVGETAEVPNDKVQGRIEAFVRAHFPTAGQVLDRWAWIEAMSCDGLPIIGPLPGSVRFLACAGFGGNETGLGVRAARAVADGLLTGRAPGVPAYLSPERFVA